MSATYNPTLVTELDYVRFLIGDTNVASPLLQDEEILALIVESGPSTSWRRYLVAADALSTLSTRWAFAGRGVLEKTVSKLGIKYGGLGTNASEALAKRIQELRERAATMMMPTPKAFRVMGTRRRDILPRRG